QARRAHGPTSVFAECTLAGQAADAPAGIRRIQQLLGSWQPVGREPDLRGWEWYYLRGLGQQALFTLRRHPAAVYTVAWSADGRRLASGGVGEAVKVWDRDTGRESTTLRGTVRQVMALSWSPDGRRLAVGGQGPAVQVWEVDAGKVVASLTGFKDRVQSLAWAPDGLHIAVGSSKVVQVWNMASGKQAATLPRPGNVEALAWSSDSRRLASGDSAGAVVVWNVEADRNNNQTIKRGGLPIT